MKNIGNVKTSRLIPMIVAAALVAVMAASALTMTQQAYANPCSITENGEDKDVSDEGARGANTDGNIACSFEDDVITFGPDQAPAGITESAGTTTESADTTTGPAVIQGSGAVTIPIGPGVPLQINIPGGLLQTPPPG